MLKELLAHKKTFATTDPEPKEIRIFLNFAARVLRKLGNTQEDAKNFLSHFDELLRERFPKFEDWKPIRVHDYYHDWKLFRNIMESVEKLRTAVEKSRISQDTKEIEDFCNHYENKWYAVANCWKSERQIHVAVSLD